METDLETLFPEPRELARAARLAFDLFGDASHNLDETGQVMGVPMETARALVQWQIARMKELQALQEGA